MDFWLALLAASLNRLVVPRCAPILDVVEVDVEPDVEAPVPEVPAVEELGAEVEEAPVVEGVELPPDPPRPRSRRLPRSLGASSAAKRSAEMLPAMRTVFCTAPNPTVAVRIALESAFREAWPALRVLRNQVSAAITRDKSTTAGTIQRRRPGRGTTRCGPGVTTGEAGRNAVFEAGAVPISDTKVAFWRLNCIIPDGAVFLVSRPGNLPDRLSVIRP